MLTLLFVIVTSSITSCKKDDNSSQAVVNSLQDGTWRITEYKDDTVDELYHFTGYSFVFSNGTVSATKNSLSVTGTYSEGTDDTYPVLILDFGTTSPFDELASPQATFQITPLQTVCDDRLKNQDFCRIINLNIK